MRIFFYNCTSPILATTLRGFVQHYRHDAVHIKDLPCGRDAADVEWMDYLASTADDWLIITADLRIQRNRVERLAFRQAGLVLAPGFQKIPMHHQASLLLWRWLDIDDLCRRIIGPFLFELPANRTPQVRAIPL